MPTQECNENQDFSRGCDDAKPSDDEVALWIALNLAQRSVYKTIDSALRSENLPPLRWYDILWAIESANEEGVRAFELEKSLLFEQSNLSRLLRRLVNEGLVTERVFEQDRRGKTLKITQKGRGIRKQMWEFYGPILHAQMSKIAADQTINISRTLGVLFKQKI